MECPVCKNQMIILELEQVEIDHCPACKGVWLDSGELQLLTEEKNLTDNFLNSYITVDDYPEKKYKCPVCKKKMKKIKFTKDKDDYLILDLCQQDGLWFDKGELQEIIEWIGSKKQDHLLSILHKIFQSEI